MDGRKKPRTAAQLQQLADARARQTPEGKAKGVQALRRWAKENPEKAAANIAKAHTPESQAKAALTRIRPWQDRFEEKYTKCAEDECWPWHGAQSSGGYGQLRIDGKAVLATHLSLLLDDRPKPFQKAHARHKCDNPPCINPAHLEWGTAKDNAQDAKERGRNKTEGLAIGRAMSRASSASRPFKSCEHCGVNFQPRWVQLRNNRNFFCGQECSLAWQKAKYTGTSKSDWYK